MTPMSVDARRRLEELLATLQRSIALLGKDVGSAAPRDLAETKAALERIARGTYGRCESCDGAIGRQRLLALPATRFCIACAAAASAGGG
jgi:DnaK suppressor protein